MSWISHAYESRLCMDLPEANSTTVRDLYCLWVACTCLSWSAVAMCALTWVVYVSRASRQHCALAVALHRRHSGLGISSARKLRSVFMKYLKMRLFKNLRYMAASIHIYIHTYIHTHNFRKCSHASVGLAQARPNERIGMLLHQSDCSDKVNCVICHHK